ncbi:MAG: hypothetical protein AAGJ40_03165 [Planctomycetota bacterium]
MRCKSLCCFLLLGVVGALPGQAHHPGDHSPVHVWPRIDVIGPLGNRLPPSYRRQFNRPTYHGGKIAHFIAPSSQEAIAWHAADHLGLYGRHGNRPSGAKSHSTQRVERHYFYPKPWEVLTVGPRPTGTADLPPSTEVIFDGNEDADQRAEPAGGGVELPAPITVPQ